MQTKNEREKIIMRMLEEGRTSREIIKACHISPNDLSAVRKKLTGDTPSGEPMHTRAYRLFKVKTPYDVALELGITGPEASKYYREYLGLTEQSYLHMLHSILGPKGISELKSLHLALNLNGVRPDKYNEYVKKASRMDIMTAEYQILVRQNLELVNRQNVLKNENKSLQADAINLKETKERLIEEVGLLNENINWLKESNDDLEGHNRILKARAEKRVTELERLDNQMSRTNQDDYRGQTHFG